MTAEELIKALTEVEAKDRVNVVAAMLSDAETLKGVLDKVNAMKPTLHTQDYVDKHIVPSVLRGHVKAEDLEAARAERDRLKKQSEQLTEDLKAAQKGDGKASDMQRQLDSLKAEAEARFEEMKKRYEEAEQKATEAEKKRKDQLFDQKLDARLLKLGIKPERVEQARKIVKDDVMHLGLNENNSQTDVAIFDPLTNDPKDATAALEAWVSQNDHFVKPKPSGGGSESAGPGKPPPAQDPTEGMSPLQMMRYGRQKEGNVGL